MKWGNGLVKVLFDGLLSFVCTKVSIQKALKLLKDNLNTEKLTTYHLHAYRNFGYFVLTMKMYPGTMRLDAPGHIFIVCIMYQP